MDSSYLFDILMGLSLLVITGVTFFVVFISKNILAAKIQIGPLIDLVYYFIYVKLSLYYLIPAILRLKSGFHFEKQDRVLPVDVFYIYLIELFSWSLWLTLFVSLLVLFKGGSGSKNRVTFIYENMQISKISIIFIGIGFLYTILSSLLGLDFLPALELFKSVFFYCGVTIGPVLVILSRKYFGGGYFYFGLFLCLFSVVSIPTRGALVYMFLFFYFLAWRLQDNNKVKAILVFISLLLVSFYFIVGSLFTGSIAINDSGKVSFDLSTTAEKSGSRSALEEIEWRFGASTRMGTAFLSLYNRGEGAGILPMKHSFMGFIPRSLNPEKPIPSTVDPDDIYSQGMYLISREINGYDSYSMTEFPSGAHFYWEFGLMGVAILSLISAFYISFCVIYFSNNGILSLSIILATFKPWGYMEPKIWVSDLILQIYQLILPLLMLMVAIKLYLIILANLRKFVNHINLNRN